MAVEAGVGTGETMALPKDGVAGMGVGMGVGTIFLKKGRERLPQPGILTSQPEEISRSSINIAEKMDRLLRVSRKRVDPGKLFDLRGVYGVRPEKSTKSTFLEGDTSYTTTSRNSKVPFGSVLIETESLGWEAKADSRWTSSDLSMALMRAGFGSRSKRWLFNRLSMVF